jgi:hypothetical protein
MEQPKETLLYENSFDTSQAEWEAEMREHWVMEGKGITECGNGFLLMRSEIFTVPRHSDGHFHMWLKKDFPANAAYEWEFRCPRHGEQGLAIIIWQALGRNGKDLFDPSIPPRRGEVMSDFHSGDINCYHTSYIARSRKIANLRKNYGFHKLADGPDLSTVSNPDEWHTIRVEQFRGTIRLLFDGHECFLCVDDGSMGGPPIEKGGKMAFRQQNNLYEGHYRGFRVFALS